MSPPPTLYHPHLLLLLLQLLLSAWTVRTANAATVVTTCASVVIARSGDTVRLQDCSVPFLRVTVLPLENSTRCEDIQISIIRVSLHGIDWSACRTALRNVAVSVEQSHIQPIIENSGSSSNGQGGLLFWRPLSSSSKESPVVVEDVLIIVKDSTVNMTAPRNGAVWSGQDDVPKLVYLPLTSSFDDINSRRILNVTVRLDSVTVTSLRLPQADHTTLVLMISTTASNVSVHMKHVSLTVEDGNDAAGPSSGSNTTKMFRALYLQFAECSGLTWTLEQSTISVSLPYARDKCILFLCQAERSPWTDTVVLVEGVTATLSVAPLTSPATTTLYGGST